MGSGEVVVGGPRLEVLVAFVGVLPVFGVGPFAQGGLDKSFSFAVGSRCVGPGSVVFDIEAVAGGAELVGAVRASVVGEQSPYADSMAGVEVEGVAEKGDGGFGLLVGQHLGKGEAGVVVDGDVQGLEAWVLMQASAAAVGAQQNLLITGKALDIEVQQIAWEGVFVSLHGGRGVQIAPSAEASALQNTAHCGWAESGAERDLIGGTMLAAELDDPSCQGRRSGAWAMAGPRGAVGEAGRALGAKALHPLGGGLVGDQKTPRGGADPLSGENKVHQLLSTAKSKSGILVDVHSVVPGKLDCSSQSASPFLIEWTTS